MSLRSPRLWLALALSLALVALAFRNVQFDDFLGALSRLDPRFLLAAIGLYFVDLWLRAIRWRVLINDAEPIRLRHLYVGLIVGYAANNLLPARVGEIARAVAAGRLSGARPAGLLGTIVVERVLDGVTVVGLLALMLPWLPAADWVRAAIIAGGAVFGLLTAALLVLARSRRGLVRLLGSLLGRAPATMRARLVALVDAGVDGVAASLTPGAATLAVLLSVVIWLVGAAIYLAVGAALGISLPVWWWVIAICLVNLATSLPLAPAGVGAFELVLIELLKLAGVAGPTAASLTLTLHGVLFVPVVAAGIGCVWLWGLSLRPPAPAAEPVAASPAAADDAEYASSRPVG